MTQKARQSQSSSKAVVHPVVLFGVDRHGKPTAARFPEGQARLAAKAAEQLDLRGGAKTKKPAQDRLPKDWDAIAPGHLVVAQESLEDGWYEAIVLEQNGDMFTLRWHEFPRERRFARHRRSLGLLFPNIAGLPAKTGPTAGQQPARAASEKTAAPKSKKGFPLSWHEIDVDHLVLAKDDGPCQSWWEAIPTEKHGDTFTLRWRDHGQLPKIARARLSLALLCPNAN
jgi:hypothetical protein